MNLAGLQAAFEAHKVPILAAAGAGVAGLALVKKRKATAGSGATGASGAAPAASFSAGGQVAGASGGASYDSTASDLYGAIQPQLEALQSQITQQSATPPTPVPAAATPTTPIASTLYKPLGTGTYVENANHTIAEVESDGSLLGMSLPEWLPFYNSGARVSNDEHTPVSAAVPIYFTTGNISDRAAALTPKSTPVAAA